MNAKRNKQKEQNRQIHTSLELSELNNKRKREINAIQKKLSEILFDLGKLVFGGVIIGGIFENLEMPLLLYGTGVLAFVSLMCWGFYLYRNSIREE